MVVCEARVCINPSIQGFQSQFFAAHLESARKLRIASNACCFASATSSLSVPAEVSGVTAPPPFASRTAASAAYGDMNTCVTKGSMYPVD